MTSSERLLVDPLNETTASDNASDSDESMFIINKNEIPVGSTDLPRGPELEERVKKDWLRRRGVEFPTNSNPEATKGIDESQPRGRGARRLPALSIDPNLANSEDHQGLSPMSSPKRRFMSLSPLRTIFPAKSVVHQDRAMSAHPSPSITTSPYSSSRSFFRSTTSLATSSFLRLPLVPSGGLGKRDSISRKLFSHKGKERARGPEPADDAWEVVDESAYAGVDKEGVERRAEHPRSLMSALESMSINTSTTNLGNSPTRSMSFTFGSQSTSDHVRTRHVHSPSLNMVHDSQTIPSPVSAQISLLREKTLITGFVDRQLNRRSVVSSPPIPEVPETVQTSTTSAPEALASTPQSPAIVPQGPPLTTVRVRQSTPSPSPAATRRIVHSPSPLRVDAIPTINNQSVVHQQALDTPLPDTPTKVEYPHHTTNPHVVPVTSGPLAARLLHDHSNSISAADTACTCNVHPQTTRIPSPALSISVYTRSASGTSTPEALLSDSVSDEPMTPMRHHYVGRPLPRPPPMVARERTGVVDSTYASIPEISYASSASSIRSSNRNIPEGLLIDLEDTTLDDISVSGASTPRRDEENFRSRSHLPLMPPSSSSVDLSQGGISDLSSLSFGSMQATSTPVPPMSPSPNTSHAAYPAHRGNHNQHQYLQHPQPRQGPRYSELTDLDVLISRLEEGAQGDGSDYEVSPGPEEWEERGLNHYIHNHNTYPDSASGFRGTWTREPYAPSRPGLASSPNANGHYQQYPPVETQRQRQYVAHWAY